jgi:hypothetical protein
MNYWLDMRGYQLATKSHRKRNGIARARVGDCQLGMRHLQIVQIEPVC